MPKAGVEPARVAPHGPQPCASTSSATSARVAILSGTAGLLEGITLGAGASLDPEPLIERALEIGDEAEAQVLGALGELVSYLEFEIMNHPGIDDPQAVLAAVAELRAQL